MITFSKTEIDTTLSDYYTESEIDTTLNLYSPTSQTLSNCYSKLYIDNTCITSSQTGTLYYNNTETDALFADKLTNIGDIDLPGMLDVGTSGYTNIRIRCNAELGGYTGYAELRAATSYDMYLNLNTSYPNGGWMYFKINNDIFIQCSASDNEVYSYKDTLIEGRLDIGKNPSFSTNWLNIHTNNTNCNGFSDSTSFTTYGGKNCSWNITSNTSDVKMEI